MAKKRPYILSKALPGLTKQGQETRNAQFFVAFFEYWLVFGLELD